MDKIEISGIWDLRYVDRSDDGLATSPDNKRKAEEAILNLPLAIVGTDDRTTSRFLDFSARSVPKRSYSQNAFLVDIVLDEEVSIEELENLKAPRYSVSTNPGAVGLLDKPWLIVVDNGRRRFGRKPKEVTEYHFYARKS